MKYLPCLRISSIFPRPFIPVSSETMDFLATPLSCLGALSGPVLGGFCFLFFPQGFLLSSGPCWVCMWVRSFPRENSLAVHPSYLQGKRSDSWQARICFWKQWNISTYCKVFLPSSSFDTLLKKITRLAKCPKMHSDYWLRNRRLKYT